jgi:hypothetical protein
MNVYEYTVQNLALTTSIGEHSGKASSKNTTPSQQSKTKSIFDPLQPARQWLNNLQVNTPELAHWLCKAIPAQCPFERDVKLFGRTLFHIPPMCKLNPLYEEVVALRFRALCYLADECGEDISAYC